MIDVKRLSELLGVTVVPVVARSGKGCEELLATLKENDKNEKKPFIISYGVQMDEGIEEVISFRESELRASEMVSTSILSNNEVVEKK